MVYLQTTISNREQIRTKYSITVVDWSLREIYCYLEWHMNERYGFENILLKKKIVHQLNWILQRIYRNHYEWSIERSLKIRIFTDGDIEDQRKLVELLFTIILENREKRIWFHKYQDNSINVPLPPTSIRGIIDADLVIFCIFALRITGTERICM